MSSPAGTGYPPIEDHAIIGDLRTVALVSTQGTVDWYCPARFDAPSLFASLLDAEKGGYFSLSCRTTTRTKQLYLPDTNILMTRFLEPAAVGEVIDFMVPETSGTATPRDLLVRQAKAVRGRVRATAVLGGQAVRPRSSETPMDGAAAAR